MIQKIICKTCLKFRQNFFKKTNEKDLIFTKTDVAEP